MGNSSAVPDGGVGRDKAEDGKEGGACACVFGIASDHANQLTNEKTLVSERLETERASKGCVP